MKNSKIDVVNRWSLFQYDLEEELSGKTIDQVIEFFQRMKQICKEDGHRECIINAHIYDDSFGGINAELEFYGDITKRDENGRLIPIKNE